MKKSELDKIVKSIKIEDMKGKVLVLDAQYFSVQDAMELQEPLKDVGLAAMVIIPANAKYDLQTKEQLKKMVNAL